MKPFFVLISIAIFHSQSALCSSSDPHESDALSKLRRDVVADVRDVWRRVEDPRWREVTGSHDQGPDIGAAKHFARIFGDRLADDRWTTSEEGSPVDKWWAWALLSAERKVVDKLYERFARFMRHQAKEGIPSPEADWLEVAEAAVRNGTARDALEKVSRLVVHGQLFKQVIKESNAHMCELQQSQNQLLYNMYDTILLTEIKGYAIMQFSWMLLKIYGKGNFTHEADMARIRYEERTALTMAAVKSALREASRAVWRCDPQHHVEGETYERLTRLLQGYIENEVDMNGENTCRENCGFYTVAKNHGCYKEEFCSRQPTCTGKILRCRYIDSDMTICQSRRTSDRRYEWIQYENGRVYGKKSYCKTGSTKVDSWWRWLFWHCSYCMCLCDQPGPTSDRFFSLKEVKTNVKMNKVVVGLRFAKKNRIIHLQISEGTLQPGGLIDAANVTWREVENVDVRRAARGVDVHEMSDTERAIDLDDLEGPHGNVMTGVRFRKVGAHLNFEIQLTPFNFTTGRLSGEKSYWMSNDNTGVSDNPRSELTLTTPDVPTNTLGPSEIDSTHDQFIKFTNSDFDADAAQSTVPYIDSQRVIPKVPVPLTGAGIYHKGRKWFGGFVAPKVFTYDFSQHIKNIPDTLSNDLSNALPFEEHSV